MIIPFIPASAEPRKRAGSGLRRVKTDGNQIGMAAREDANVPAVRMFGVEENICV
jgi:hypothetical protein